MKQTLLFLLFSLISIGGFAQITVTNATFPVIGDTLVTATSVITSGIDIGTPGADKTWDFSTLASQNINTVVFQDADLGSAAADVPNANLFTEVLGTENYYQSTSTSFSLLAGKGNDPIGLGIEALLRFVPPIINRRAPMNFGDVNTSEANTSIAFAADVIPDTLASNIPFAFDSIRLRINQERTDVVDAYGTLTIPGGTYEVLREKRSLTRSTRIDILIFLGWIDITDIVAGVVGVDAGLGEIASVDYLFFNDTEKEIIASVSADETGTMLNAVTYKFNDIINDIDNPLGLQPEFSLFPNPATSAVSFEFSGLTAGDYTMNVFNMLGKNIWQQEFSLSESGIENIDLNNFQNGTYLFSLIDNQGNPLKTRRLIVLK